MRGGKLKIKNQKSKIKNQKSKIKNQIFHFYELLRKQKYGDGPF